MHHVDCSQWNQRDADDERNHENQIHKCKASIKRLRLQEQQKKNVQDQRSVMVQQNVQNERINTQLHKHAYYTAIYILYLCYYSTLCLPTCSVHIELLMMGAFDIETCRAFYLIFVVPCIMFYSSEVSPTRCNNCVFILRNGFTLHVSGDNLTHHQEYICCIWPQVSWFT